MSLRMLWARGAGLLLVAALARQMSAQAPHQLTKSTMPFDLVSEFEVVVQGQIGELDGLRFIVDTGSSFSVIDRRVAEKLGLVRHSRKVLNFDRNLAVDWVNVPELRIGPLRVASMGMILTRLADISEFAENVDGIIGMDVLSRAQKLSIDYERKRISIEFEEGRGSETSTMNAFVVPVVIQGTSVHLVVDTGLQYVVLYQDRLRDALPHLRIEGEPRSAALGRLPVTQVNLPGVRIFGREAVTPALLVAGSGKTSIGGLDGYLGPASLHARRLELDFAAKVLRWE